MQNLQNNIQEILKDHKRKNRYVAFLLVLSMLVSIIVPTSLIMPAVSMTADSEESIEVTETMPLEDDLDTVSNDIGAAATEDVALLNAQVGSPAPLDTYITGIQATIKGKTQDWSAGKEQNKYNVTFDLEYTIPKEEVSSKFNLSNGGTNTVYFTMKTGETANDDSLIISGYGETGIVYSGGEEIGTYKITPEGIVYIEFKDDFLNHAVSDDSDIKGSFYFQATATQDSDNTEDKTVSIANKDVTIPIYEYEHPADLKVSKNVVGGSNGYNYDDNTATYEIVVSSGNGTRNPITLTDTLTGDMLFKLNNNSVTITKKDSNGNVIETLQPNVVVADGVATIENLPELGRGESYTLQYQVYVPEDKENNATTITSYNSVRAQSGKLDQQANASIYATIRPTLQKDGTYDSNSDKITWKVVVSNPNKQSLEGYTLRDSAIGKNIIIDPSENCTVNSDGSITFGADTKAEKYTITYETDASDIHGTDVKNTATLMDDTYTVTAEKTVSVPKQQTIQKTASYDGENITWTITVNNQFQRDLSGYTITDDMLSQAVAGSFTITPNGAATLTDGIITFAQNTKEQQYTIQYKTTANKGESVSNEAILKQKQIEIAKDDETFQVPNTNRTLGKSATFVAGSAGEKYIEWTIEVHNPYGANMKDYTVTDAAFEGCQNFVVEYQKEDGSWESISGAQQSGGKYTFPEGTRYHEYRIRYKTSVPTGELWVQNKAGDSDGNNTGTGCNVPDKLQDIESKTGSYNQETGYITWKIIINNPYGVNSSSWTDKDVQDDYLKEALDFKLYEELEAEDHLVTQGVSEIDKGQGTYRFPDGLTGKKYIIVYTTKPSNSNDYNIKNTARFNGGEKSTTVNAAPRSEVDKQVSSNEVQQSSDGEKITIPWTVNLRFSQGSFAGKTYTDTISSTFVRSGVDIGDALKEKGITLSHYMTREQLNALQIFGQKPNSSGLDLIDKSNYTIVTEPADGNVEKFKITFSDNDTIKQYSALQLRYSTTGEGIDTIGQEEVLAEDKLTFYNESTFEEETDKNKYDITKKPALQKYDITTGEQQGNNTVHQLEDVLLGDVVTLKWKIVANESMNYSSSEEIKLEDTMPDGLTLDHNSVVVVCDGKTLTKDTDYTFENDAKKMTIIVPGEKHQGKKVEVTYSAYMNKHQFNGASMDFKNIVEDKEKNTSVTQTQTIQKILGDFTKADNPSFKPGSATELLSNEIPYLLDINPNKKDLNPNGNQLTMIDSMNKSGVMVSPLQITLLEDTIQIYEVQADGTHRPLEQSEYKFNYTIEEVPANGDNPPVDSAIHVMTFTVPDEMHIQIGYTYRVMLSPDTTWKEAPVRNTATLTGVQEVQTTGGTNYKFVSVTSGAQAVIQKYIQIVKVEKGHYDVKLPGAIFTLEKWSETENKWIPMSGRQVSETGSTGSGGTDKSEKYVPVWAEGDNKNQPAMQMKTSSNGMVALPYLESGILYRVTEVNSPKNYYFDPDARYYYFYEEKKDGTETLPADSIFTNAGVEKGDCSALKNGDEMTISNEKRSVEVEKVWKGNGPTSPIKVGLYRTTVEPVPASDKVHVIINLTDAKGKKTQTKFSVNSVEDVKFELSNCMKNKLKFKDDGVESDAPASSVSYGSKYDNMSSEFLSSDNCNFIKEDSAIYNEWNYQFFAKGLGSDIKYIQYDLSLVPMWNASVSDTSYDSFTANGVEIEGDQWEYEMPEGIELESAKIFDDNGSVIFGEATLSASNNWQYSFVDPTDDHLYLPAADKEGNAYYYYVKEEDVPNDYEVSYIGNGVKNGSVEIVNTYVPKNLTVKKEWVASDEQSKPQIVLVQLYKSITPPDENGNPPVLTDADKVGEQVPLTLQNNYTNTWTSEKLRELCGGSVSDADGNPYYFYVREVNVPENYVPTYTDGIQSGEMGITNTYYSPIKISVQKKWFKLDGTEDTASHDPVTVNLWRSTTPPPDAPITTTPSSEPTNEFMDSFGSYESSSEATKQYSLNGKKVKKISVDLDEIANYLNIRLRKNGGQIKYIGVDSQYNLQWSDFDSQEFDKSTNRLTLSLNEPVDADTLEFQVQGAGCKLSNVKVYYEGYEETTTTTTTTTTTQTTEVKPIETSVVPKDAKLVRSITLPQNETITVENLPARDPETGELWYYYFEEVAVPGYGATYEKNGVTNGGAVTINNKELPAPVKVSVKKVWENVPESERPTSIEVYLYQSLTQWPDVGKPPEGATFYKKQTLSAEDWSYTWEELPKANVDNQLYYYYVVEQPLNGYDVKYDPPQIAGNGDTNITITNTRKTISIKLKKEWEGEGTPGQEVTVKLHRSTTPRTEEVPLISTSPTSSTATTTTTTATNTTTTTSSETTTTTTTTSSQEITTGITGGAFTLDGNNKIQTITGIDSSRVVESIQINLDKSYLSTCNEYVQLETNGLLNNNSQVNNYSDNYNWNEDSITISINEKIDTITIALKTGSKVPILGYIITYASTSRSAPSRAKASYAAAEEIMPILRAEANPKSNIVFDADGVSNEIKITETDIVDMDNWAYLAENLPIYDADGKPYYYWVEEVDVQPGGLSTYDISYLFDDADDNTSYVINAAKPGGATATIRNTKTQNESYELPSVGGIGTRWYTLAGLLVLGGGCGGFATTHLIRRFRRRKCTK